MYNIFQKDSCIGVVRALGLLIGCTSAIPYNTFDGEGFPACSDVSQIIYPNSTQGIIDIVKTAAQYKLPVRASGAAHHWYDNMCADNTRPIIIKTEYVNRILNFSLEQGFVEFEAGVTFLQLSDYLHQRSASIGYTLVNWNMTIAGSLATGSHRSSIREPSMVAAGVLEMDIIDGKGNVRTLSRDNQNDEWLAASTSLGLLGVISRVKFRIYPDQKVYAMQKTLSENEVLNGDIYNLIAPYATANLWWWPAQKKFHHRYYDVVDAKKYPQQGFQNTFSISQAEAVAAKAILESGKFSDVSNLLAESIFFGLWEKPNFREKTTNKDITSWPVYGWNYDVLIGGLYPDQRPEWEYGLHGYTLELAVPIIKANELLRRVRELFDAAPFHVASTYRSGINIKFGQPYDDLLGQVTTTTADGADWKKGAIMFDFPTYRPSFGDQKRFHDEFYINLAKTLQTEFPTRPHWTKNTREVFRQAAQTLDQDHLARFKAVRQQFDPNGIFKSALGEILGLYK